MLTRVRVGFALLALVLLVPLGVLITRSFDTLEHERELQHAAVANRVFDEAERELTEFLRAEQARPAEQYRGSDAEPAPLAPSQPFVLGYFQIDRSGRVQSPFAQPGREAELRDAVRTLGPATAELRAKKAEMTKRKPAPAPKADYSRSFADEVQAPGTTRNVQSVDLLTGREAEPVQPRKEIAAEEALGEKAGPSSSSEALEQLGKIAQQKARSDVVAEADSMSLRRGRSSAEGAGSARGLSAPPATETVPSPAASVPQPVVPALAADPKQISVDDVANRPAEVERVQRTPIAPSRLSGERIDATRMLLYRTALLDDGVPYQQGLWVDLDALGEWLRGRVLGESELRDSLELELVTAESAAAPALPEARFVYEHRFAEPFDGLQARLAITPLGDGGAARYIGWMAVLMVAASTLGLYALYRTAAVAIDFGERRSNFAAAVSHELKTPLTAIRMYAEMLRDGMAGDEGKRQEYYATITSESERLTRLINNVLEWSKLESQQRERVSVAASIAPSLREVVRVLNPHAQALGFELALDLPADLPPVRHDPDALQQILFNLIDNALKYARASEPRRIEIRASRADAGVSVCVRDHGPGVEPRSLPLIFDAFYRAGDELTRQTKGTGIGLALVRGLAQAMGGSVHARNAPDGGLELELRLRGS